MILKEFLDYAINYKEIMNKQDYISIRDDLICRYHGPTDFIPTKLLQYDVLRCTYNFMTEQFNIEIRG